MGAYFAYKTTNNTLVCISIHIAYTSSLLRFLHPLYLTRKQKRKTYFVFSKRHRQTIRPNQTVRIMHAWVLLKVHCMIFSALFLLVLVVWLFICLGWRFSWCWFDDDSLVFLFCFFFFLMIIVIVRTRKIRTYCKQNQTRNRITKKQPINSSKRISSAL